MVSVSIRCSVTTAGDTLCWLTKEDSLHHTLIAACGGNQEYVRLTGKTVTRNASTAKFKCFECQRLLKMWLERKDDAKQEGLFPETESPGQQGRPATD